MGVFDRVRRAAPSMLTDAARLRYERERLAARMRTTVDHFFKATNFTLIIALALFGAALVWFGQARQMFVALIEAGPDASNQAWAGGGAVEIGAILAAATLFSGVAFVGYRRFTELTALALRSGGRLSAPWRWIGWLRSFVSILVAGGVWIALILAVRQAMADVETVEELATAAGVAEAVERGAAAVGASDFAATAARGDRLSLLFAGVGVVVVAALFLLRESRATGGLVKISAFCAVLFVWLGQSFGVAEMSPEFVRAFDPIELTPPERAFADGAARIWEAIGPIATALLAATALLGVVAGLVWVAEKMALPAFAFAIALIAALVGGSAAWNQFMLRIAIERADPLAASGERVTLSVSRSMATSGRDVGGYFADWMVARARAGALDAFEDYPIFVVAAQGGGMYAAANASAFLGRAQDRCPHFIQHVFAISSVSGGAVGAALFNARMAADPAVGVELTPAAPCDLGPRAEAGPVEADLAALAVGDYAAPLTAALARDWLFPISLFDPTGPEDDRARRLEAAFLRRLEDPLSRLYLANEFYRHWTPEEPLPALVFNLTDAATGARVAMAPFERLGAGAARTLRQLAAERLATRMRPRLRAEDDASAVGAIEPPSVMQGASASARFPYILPDYRVPLFGPDDQAFDRFSFVDGGYVDSSGVETAREIVAEIEREIRLAKACLRGVDPGACAASAFGPRADAGGQASSAGKASPAARASDAGETALREAAREAASRMSVTLIALTTDHDAPAAREEAMRAIEEEALGSAVALADVGRAAPGSGALVSLLQDMLAPVTAAWAVRNLRAEAVIGQARRDYQRGDGDANRPALAPAERLAQRDRAEPLEIVALNVASFEVPLAWRLSRSAQALVARYAGDPSECRPDALTPWSGAAALAVDADFASDVRAEAAQIRWRIHQNDCAMRRILTTLTPRSAEPASAAKSSRSPAPPSDSSTVAPSTNRVLGE